MINYATLVIDMQDDFLVAKPKHDVESAIDKQKQILEQSRRAGFEIIYVLYDGFGELYKGYKPNGNKVFRKSSESAINDELTAYLQKKDIGGLVVMGCNASCCILDTVTDALIRGYDVIVPEGTLLDDHKSHFEDTLQGFKEKGLLLRLTS
jgi:nicotinamidase-related amidase